MERVHEAGEGPPGLTRTAKITVASFAVALAFMLGFGSVKAWHNLVTLPRTYDALRDRGIPSTARVVTCRVPTGGHASACQLRLDYGGHPRTVVYDQNVHQFDGLVPGSPVPMLVDPRRPSRVYTVHDVELRTDAGFDGPTVLALAFIVIGLLGLYLLSRLVLLARRTRAKWLADEAARNPGHSPSGADQVEA